MSRIMVSRHVSCVIGSEPATVYEFAREPDNLSRWAAGLAGSAVRHSGEDLIAESPMGTVRVRFAPRNTLGVLDHDVTLPDGSVVSNPLRVLAHPAGAEVVFTLRQLGMTAEAFERDTAMVLADLQRLKALIEGAQA